MVAVDAMDSGIVGTAPTNSAGNGLLVTDAKTAGFGSAKLTGTANIEVDVGFDAPGAAAETGSFVDSCSPHSGSAEVG